MLSSIVFSFSILSLLIIIPSTAVDLTSYDPLADINDDGKINIVDVTMVAKRFGTAGSPINKTDLLLEVQTARAHNETYSATLETKSGYDFEWRDLAAMSLDITVQTRCTLIITFSAQAITSTEYLALSIRALVDSVPSNPPAGVTLTKLTDWATHSFTFYSSNVLAGTHTVKIQWLHNDEVGAVQVSSRTLVVTASPT